MPSIGCTAVPNEEGARCKVPLPGASGARQQAICVEACPVRFNVRPLDELKVKYGDTIEARVYLLGRFPNPRGEYLKNKL
jgi:hypothetical protein